MNEKVLTVTELTQAIKGMLESRFTLLQVKGEVTNLRQQASGHLYFTLKDRESQVSAVLFRGNARHVTALPKAGDQVIVKGELSVYAPRGSYQIIVRQLEHAGVGELLLKLHELKAQLEKKGWFDPKRKKALPKYPKTIGVVTSPTGSVIQDILHVLRRRFKHFHLILNPVRVQGEGAATEIAQAIETFNRYLLADVLIVGRGGGSLEDLWAFNEECVAHAIFRSKIPVIAAVGHETDLSIADCVADVRAPTPSAAAEVSVKELASQLEFLAQVKKRSAAQLFQTVKHHRSLLEGIQRQPFFAAPYTLLSEHLQKMDEVSENLDRTIKTRVEQRGLRLHAFQKHLEGLQPLNQVQNLKDKLEFFSQGLGTAWSYKQKQLKKNLFSLQSSIDHCQKGLFELKRERLRAAEFGQMTLCLVEQKLKNKKEQFSRLISHLTSIDPKNLLKKGYCIPFAEKGDSVMMASRSLKVGEKLALLFHDGRVKTTIDEVIPKSHE